MLIDLHAHVVHEGFFNQHPHWGPDFEDGENGELRLKVGDWRLRLGQSERIKAIKNGTAANKQQFFARASDPKIRLKAMDAAHQDVQVISIPSHTYMYWTDDEFSVAYANKVNSVLDDYCSRGENRLFYWAHAPLNVPDACPDIIRRAVAGGYAKGIGTGGQNFGGRNFDSPDLDPVWATMCDLDLPIFVHGYNQSATWGAKADTDHYETTAIVGMNHDETLAFWHLICGGVLDRFPELKVYITHAGGFVPFQLGRLEETNKNLETTHNKHPVSYYLKNFWFDPEVHDPRVRQVVVDVIGADHLLYGTNFAGSDSNRHDLTDGLNISDADRNKIRFENAVNLLHLDVETLGHAEAPPVGQVLMPN